MQTDLSQAGEVITLSSAVLQHFRGLSPTALRAYIYFCSLPSSQPITVSIPVIAEAVGKAERTTVGALEELCKCGLIVRDSGNGAQANQYRVSFGDSSPAMASVRHPDAGGISTSDKTSGPEAPDAETSREAEQTPQGAANPPSAIPLAPPATVAELVGDLYRDVSASELARLKSLFPNEEILLAKLTALRDSGSTVAADMGIDFLAGALHVDLSRFV
jgi:predicted transcriptional regulator